MMDIEKLIEQLCKPQTNGESGIPLQTLLI
jgi:hypothetical protein